MDRLSIYDRVNASETLDELAEIIESLADSNGDIQGRSRKFNAEKMALFCRHFNIDISNALTREYGIRQQAIYLSI